MSLDLYLKGEPQLQAVSTGIFIRVGGEQFEITRAKWDRRNPGREPVTCVSDDAETTTVWHRNITHNLGRMAMAAGLYEAMWRPDEHGMTHARMLIEPLAAGLEKLKAKPEKFRGLNPDNGWGTYELLLDFTESALAACRAHPDCTVYACR